MTHILLTGYEPFGDHETNPSATVTESLDGMALGGATVVGRELPVVFDEALPRVRSLIDTHDPVAILSTGLMPERRVLTVERTGINVRDCDDVPDNDDQRPVDQPVVADGPDAYFATLPVKRLVAAAREASVPARVSNTPALTCATTSSMRRDTTWRRTTWGSCRGSFTSRTRTRRRRAGPTPSRACRSTRWSGGSRRCFEFWPTRRRTTPRRRSGGLEVPR